MSDVILDAFFDSRRSYFDHEDYVMRQQAFAAQYEYFQIMSIAVLALCVCETISHVLGVYFDVLVCFLSMARLIHSTTVCLFARKISYFSEKYGPERGVRFVDMRICVAVKSQLQVCYM